MVQEEEEDEDSNPRPLGLLAKLSTERFAQKLPKVLNEVYAQNHNYTTARRAIHRQKYGWIVLPY